MAFGETSVLDNFNRADGALGANWTTPIWNSSLAVKSNGCQTSSGSGWGDALWAAATYGDCEAYADIVTVAIDDQWILLRLADAGNNYDGYFVDRYGTSVGIYRRDNGTNTQIGATITQTFANGDALGFEAIGSTLTAYRKPSGGSWASLGTRSDATYTSGNIGLGTVGVAPLDNFGGGEIAAGGANLLALLGVG